MWELNSNPPPPPLRTTTGPLQCQQPANTEYTHSLLISPNKGVNNRSRDVTQTQQRPEPPMLTLTWHANKYMIHKFHQRYIIFSSQPPLHHHHPPRLLALSLSLARSLAPPPLRPQLPLKLHTFHLWSLFVGDVVQIPRDEDLAALRPST